MAAHAALAFLPGCGYHRVGPLKPHPQVLATLVQKSRGVTVTTIRCALLPNGRFDRIEAKPDSN